MALPRRDGVWNELDQFAEASAVEVPDPSDNPYAATGPWLCAETDIVPIIINAQMEIGAMDAWTIRAVILEVIIRILGRCARQHSLTKYRHGVGRFEQY
jgi:hypothetical protein